MELEGLNKLFNIEFNCATPVLVEEAELARRRSAWDARREPSKYTRGWYRLYIDTVLQADAGADLDFLVGKSSADVTRESH